MSAGKLVTLQNFEYRIINNSNILCKRVMVTTYTHHECGIAITREKNDDTFCTMYKFRFKSFMKTFCYRSFVVYGNELLLMVVGNNCH
jgi:hypothetical protein